MFKEASGAVVVGIVAFVAFIGLIFLLDYTGLMWESFIGPKRENVRRQVYEQTRSFNEGKRQELVKYYYDWQKADPVGRQGICGIVRQAFAGYDTDKLSYEQQNFVRQCGGL